MTRTQNKEQVLYTVRLPAVSLVECVSSHSQAWCFHRIVVTTCWSNYPYVEFEILLFLRSCVSLLCVDGHLEAIFVDTRISRETF